MKTAPWLAFLLLFVHSLAAFAPMPVPQARPAPISGATVQTLFHTPSENQMTLRVTNTSTKNITGYILSIHGLTGDGKRTDFHSIYDFLANQMFVARFEGTGNEDYYSKQVGPPFLAPNQNYDEISAMPATANYEDISVLITAIAYDDKSAEAISPEALEPLITTRRAEAAAIQKANEIIAANPDPQAAIKKIKDLRDVSSKSARLELNAHTLDMIAEDLQDNPDLKAYQARRERERAVWADQAQLKLGGAL
jgi:hypothetical protein